MPESNLKLSADSRGLEAGVSRADRALEKLGARAGKTEDKLDKLKNKFSAFRAGAAALGVGLVIRGFLGMSDAATTVDNKLRLVTNSTDELNAVYGQLFKNANETRTSLEANVTQFNRLALSTKTLNLSYSEQLDIVKSLNQAIQISGATATEASAASIQFSQGLASGALRGDELRSVLEQIPRVADVIAKKFDTDRGGLRKLGEEGKLTAKKIVEAFQDAAPELAKEFEKIVPTVEGAFTVFKNNALDFVRSANKGSGAAELLSRGILALAKNFNIVVTVVGSLAILLAGKMVAAITAMGVAFAATPFGAVIVGITAIAAAIGFFGDSTVEVMGESVTGWETIKAAIQAFWTVVKPIFISVWETWKTVAGGIIDAFKLIFGTAADNFGGIGKVVGVVFNFVIGVIKGTMKTAEILVKNAGAAIEGAFVGAGNVIISIFEGIVNFVPNAIAAVGNAINLFTDDAGDGLVEFTKKIKIDFGEIAQSDEAKKVGEDIKNVWKDAFSTDFAAEFQDEMKKNIDLIVKNREDADKLAALLAGGFSDGAAKAAKATKELIKEREKFLKTVQREFDEVRSKTMSAVDIVVEQYNRQIAKMIELGLESAVLRGKLDAIFEGNLADAIEEDMEAINDFKESIKDAHQEVQESTGGSVEVVLAWAATQRQELENLGLQYTEYAEMLEGIIQKDLKEAYDEDLENATDWASGIERAITANIEQIGSQADLAARATNTLIDGTRDAIGQFIDDGKVDFRGLAHSIATDIAKMTLEFLILLPILEAIKGSMSDMGFGGGISGVAGAIGSLFGFREGGQFQVGGAGGVDSQVVAFKATPGESVSIQPAGATSSKGEMRLGGKIEDSGNFEMLVPFLEALINKDQSVNIVNANDPNEAIDAIGSRRGSEAILNVIERNPRAIRRLLG
jgi:tape measure domain-containing protein